MRPGSLLHLAWGSLRLHRLVHTITILIAALAMGLAFAVFAVADQARQAFVSGGRGYDAVLGARGSEVQLVLNAVFHLDTSPGNIPWSLYQTIATHPGVRRAIPMAVGDNFRGFRVVGITDDFFQDPPSDGIPMSLLSGGRWFDSQRREAVIGSAVARSEGLKVGDTFSPYHGLNYDEKMRHSEVYLIVGILETTNTPLDRVLFIPLEGIFRMEGHLLRGSGENYVPQPGQAIPDEHREVSAVLLDLDSPQMGFQLAQKVNRQGKVATLAYPVGRTVLSLFDKLGWAHQLLIVVAYLVLFIAVGTITAVLIQTLEGRKREFAVLRALGFPRKSLFRLLLLESTLLALLGSLLGLVVYAAMLAVVSLGLRHQTGIVLEIFHFHPVFLWGPLVMTVGAVVAGLLPAWRAYRSPVIRYLQTEN